MPGPRRENEVDEVGQAVGRQFLKNSRAVDVDGARAGAERTADFLVRLAGNHQFEHVAFARRQQGDTPCRVGRIGGAG